MLRDGSLYVLFFQTHKNTQGDNSSKLSGNQSGAVRCVSRDYRGEQKQRITHNEENGWGPTEFSSFDQNDVLAPGFLNHGIHRFY